MGPKSQSFLSANSILRSQSMNNIRLISKWIFFGGPNVINDQAEITSRFFCGGLCSYHPFISNVFEYVALLFMVTRIIDIRFYKGPSSLHSGEVMIWFYRLFLVIQHFLDSNQICLFLQSRSSYWTKSARGRHWLTRTTVRSFGDSYSTTELSAYIYSFPL